MILAVDPEYWEVAEDGGIGVLVVPPHDIRITAYFVLTCTFAVSENPLSVMLFLSA